jgi:hypothetical protein
MVPWHTKTKRCTWGHSGIVAVFFLGGGYDHDHGPGHTCVWHVNTGMGAQGLVHMGY